MRYACEADQDAARRHGAIMTSPAVTELPRPLEPVSRDTFLDDLAAEEDAHRPGDEEASVAPSGR
jgi:hypothetical protein